MKLQTIELTPRAASGNTCSDMIKEILTKLGFTIITPVNSKVTLTGYYYFRYKTSQIVIRIKSTFTTSIDGSGTYFFSYNALMDKDALLSDSPSYVNTSHLFRLYQVNGLYYMTCLYLTDGDTFLSFSCEKTESNLNYHQSLTFVNTGDYDILFTSNSYHVATGKIITNVNRMISFNTLPVLSDATYLISLPMYLLLADALATRNKAYIKVPLVQQYAMTGSVASPCYPKIVISGKTYRQIANGLMVEVSEDS